MGCIALTHITLPEGLTSMGERVFRACGRLNQIIINSNDDVEIARINQIIISSAIARIASNPLLGPQELRDKVIKNPFAPMVAEAIEEKLQRLSFAPQINPVYQVAKEKGPFTDEILTALNPFLIDESVHYKRAEAAMKKVPWPEDDSATTLDAYQARLQSIVDASLVALQDNGEGAQRAAAGKKHLGLFVDVSRAAATREGNDKAADAEVNSKPSFRK